MAGELGWMGTRSGLDWWDCLWRDCEGALRWNENEMCENQHGLIGPEQENGGSTYQSGERALETQLE